MRIIVAGSVTWSDQESIRRELCKAPDHATIIFGDCQGADAIAGEVATELGLSIEPMVKNDDDERKFCHLAWKGLNERMIESRADLILVFHPNVSNSSGSKHLIELATLAGIEVQTFAS